MSEKEKDMAEETRLEVLKKEVKMAEGALELNPNGVKDIMLDKSIRKKNHAAAYLLKSFSIPASYFNAVPENHQKEILSNAVRSYPEVTSRVVLSGKELLAAGPAGVAPFSEVFGYFGDMVEEDNLFVKGSLFEGGGVQLYKIIGSLASSKWKVGLSIMLTSLFGRGFSVRPLVFEIRCINGLVDVKESGQSLRLNPKECLEDSLKEVFSYAGDVSLKRVEKYNKVLSELHGLPALKGQAFTNFLNTQNFPKSFTQKVQALSSSIEEGALKAEYLPPSLTTRLDNMSTLTYTAQGFNVWSKSKLEETLFSKVGNLLTAPM